MKKRLIYVGLAVAALSLQLVSCEEYTETETRQTSTAVTKPNQESNNALFEDFMLVLDFYDALAEEGETIVLKAIGNEVDIIAEEKVAFSKEHDYEMKSRIDFARWCEKQVNAGKTLRIGKYPDGTYWADIVN